MMASGCGTRTLKRKNVRGDRDETPTHRKKRDERGTRWDFLMADRSYSTVTDLARFLG